MQNKEKPEETAGTAPLTAYPLPVPVPAQRDPVRFGWSPANVEGPVAAAGNSEREASLLEDASSGAASSVSAAAMPPIPSLLGISTLDQNDPLNPTVSDSQSASASIPTDLPPTAADLLSGQTESPESSGGLTAVLTDIASNSKTARSRFETKQPGDGSPDSADLDSSATTQAAQPGSKLSDGTQPNLSDLSLNAIQSVISGSATPLPPSSTDENGGLAKSAAKGNLKLSPMDRLMLAGRAESFDASVSGHSSQARYEALERSPEGLAGNRQLAADNLSPSSSVAFTARLVPQPPATSTPSLTSFSASHNPVKTREQDSPDALQSEGSTVDADQAPDSQDSGRETVKSDQTDPGTDTIAPTAPADFAATPIQAAHTEIQKVPEDSPAEDEPTPPAPPTFDTEPVKGVAGQEGTPASPARDIQLQLTEGGQRVDVRLSERGGEVRVAVRTPDTQLAGALRDQLPRLSAQLEQTGFRTETWHPAMSEVSAPDRRMPSTQSFSNPPGGDQNQPRQDSQQQQSSRQPKANPAPAPKSSQRKDFAWLMSQLP